VSDAEPRAEQLVRDHLTGTLGQPGDEVVAQVRGAELQLGTHFDPRLMEGGPGKPGPPSNCGAVELRGD